MNTDEGRTDDGISHDPETSIFPAGAGYGDAMATTKSASHEKTKTAAMKSHRAKQGGNPCKPGYEPVPGKKPGSQGSCRKKGG